APVRVRDLPLVERAVLLDRLLGGVSDEEAAGAGADVGPGRVVAVGGVTLAVVVDELAVGLARLEGVRRDDRVAPGGGELDGDGRGRRAVPDPEGPRVRPGQRRRVLERGAVPALPRDVLLPPQP